MRVYFEHIVAERAELQKGVSYSAEQQNEDRFLQNLRAKKKFDAYSVRNIYTYTFPRIS